MPQNQPQSGAYQNQPPPVQSHGTPGASCPTAKKNKSGAIAAAIIVGVFVICGTIIGAVLLSRDNSPAEQPTHTTAATAVPPSSEWVRVDLVNRHINDAMLAEMVASGEIPANVSQLILYENQITDLTPLMGLTNLRELYLASNQITDVSPLRNLTDLEILRLSHNQITDISPLRGLSNLEHLSLQENPITDWSPVAHVQNVSGRP
jgi:hypothetical protein